MTSDYSRMADRVSDLRDNLEREHKQATRESMGDLQTEVENEIRNNDSVARRVLVGDVWEQKNYRHPTFVARSVSVPGWSVYLEHGSGPRGRTDTQPDHQQFMAPSPLPPIEPIETWVIAKNITSEHYDNPHDLAVAIQRTIGEIGTFPHPFLRPAWHGAQGYQNVIQANMNAIRTALRRM